MQEKSQQYEEALILLFILLNFLLTLCYIKLY